MSSDVYTTGKVQTVMQLDDARTADHLLVLQMLALAEGGRYEMKLLLQGTSRLNLVAFAAKQYT